MDSLIIDVKNTLSDNAIGLVASSLDIHCLCTLPFAAILAFVQPSLFWTKNINDSIAFLFSDGVMSLTDIRVKQFC